MSNSLQPDDGSQTTGFFVGGRRSGKTKRLIEWAYGHPGRVIIVHSIEEQNRVLKAAKEMNRTLNTNQVVSYDKSLGGLLRGRDVVVGIDNVEMLLGRLFVGLPIDRVTATGHMIN